MHSVSMKQKAQKLRLHGKSYSEISSELHISKSTLHSWLSELTLSDKARKRIEQRVNDGSLKGLLKRNRNQTHLARQRMAKNKAIGRSIINNISPRDLLIIGAVLYWGEGYKRTIINKGKARTHHPISLANSDPEVIRVFLRFLREHLSVEDSAIKVDVHLYAHINEAEALNFWAKVTNLPLKNFGKVYYGVSKRSEGRRGYNRLPYGTAHVRLNSTQLFHQIMGMIEGIISKT